MNDNASFEAKPSAGVSASELSAGTKSSSVVAYRRREQQQLPAAGAVSPLPTAAAAEGELQIGRIVFGALRGRYIWVVVLGLITGALAGAVAWRFAKPKYESDGLVRIRYTLPEVMQETDQNKPMPMYDTFMQSQKLLITSHAVLDMAIVDPVWKAMGRAVPLEPDRYFARNLKVDIKPRSEYIQIAVQDEDPATAAAAVNAIINAYADRYKFEEERLSKERLGVLEDKERTLTQDVARLTKDLADASKAFGTSKLDMIYDAAATRWNKAEAALSEIRVAIASAPINDPATATKTPAEPAATQPLHEPDESLTPEELAAVDPQMREYVDARDKALGQLKRLRLHYGEDFGAVRDSKTDYEDADQKVKSYLPLSRTLHAAALARGPDGRSSIPLAGQSLASLKRTEANLQAFSNDALKDMREFGQQRSRLESLTADLNSKRDELERVQQRLGMIRNETSLGGRLNVVSTGEIPLTPARELRLYATPAAGLAGACLPAGLFVIGSLITRRRFRFSDEAATHAPLGGQLLGILPTLESADDAEAMTVAAHSVHQIRVTLRSQASRENSNVYLVTSSDAGDGKTSLTMSLGFSFAASGTRTLVIDCDLVGRHLSRNLGVTEVDGFNEALKNHRLQKLVRKAGPNLYIMSAGRAADADACGISAAKVRSILADARKYFEVILIDSGPILGSVEAAVLAQEVDGVVFTIARGQERSLVERSVRRIDALGARMEGFVFNRAESGDFRQSAYSSSSRMTASAPGEGRRRIFNLDPAGRMASFGPIVQAMLSSIPYEFHGTQQQP